MTLTKITDTATLERQGLLLAAMTAVGAHWRERAAEERAHGHILHALGCERTAWRFEQIAGRTRKRLVAASGLTEQDVAAPSPEAPVGECVLPGCNCTEQIRPGYRIRLPARPARPVWWRRWAARLLIGWLP